MEKQKSILYFDTGISGYGGSFKSLAYTVNMFSKNFTNVYVVYLNDSKILSELNHDNVETIKISDLIYCKKRRAGVRLLIKGNRLMCSVFPSLKPKSEWLLHRRTLKKVERCIDLKKIDLIHFNIDPFREFFAYKLCLKYNIPAVFHLRVFHNERNPLHKLKFLNMDNNKFIAISQAIQESWKTLGLDEKRISVIPNFIPFESTGVKESSSGKSPVTVPEGKRLLFVGRIEKIKGIDFLIQAFAKLPAAYVLYVIGTGSYLSELNQQMKELEISDRVHIEGYKENIDAYYRDCDVLIVPSRVEPMGRVVLEGMMHKIPVIASEVGGMAEIIRDGHDGFFFEFGDSENLCSKIETLMRDDEMRKKIISNAYKKVTSLYSEEHYYRQVSNIYNSLLEQHGFYTGKSRND